MAHGRNKYQSRENRAKVREVLMQVWNPIGVQNFPEGQDEYDAYADKAYVMLMDERAPAATIASYLFDIATGTWDYRRERNSPIAAPKRWSVSSACVRNSRRNDMAAPLPTPLPKIDPSPSIASAAFAPTLIAAVGARVLSLH